VGKRNLETAIRQSPQYDVTVRWKPYQLRPDNPREGVEKAPNTAENPRVGARMKQAGQSVGIDFTGKCDRSPNTLYAHTLLAYVADKHGFAAQNKVQERLFQAYFTDGHYPSIDNLCTLVAEVQDIDPPVDVPALRRVFEEAELEKTVAQEVRQNSKVANGVPFFYFNGKPAFSGAQPPAAFAECFEKC
jgi:predicted DsbA family dithiol-disulfide isomerase